jgi:hypothetical protein
VTLALTENASLGRVVWRQRMPVSREHRPFWAGSRWGIRGMIGRGNAKILCVFPVIGVAVRVKSCDACGDGEYYLRSSCLASENAGVWGASIVVDQKSMGHTVAERSWKDADIVCISCS